MTDGYKAKRACERIVKYCQKQYPDCSECIFAWWNEATGGCLFAENIPPADWLMELEGYRRADNE